jgi:hypothetical protein
VPCNASLASDTENPSCRPPLQSVSKQEASTRPCPRIVLVACTALVTGGLDTPDLFREEAEIELTHFVLNAFEDGGDAGPLLGGLS